MGVLETVMRMKELEAQQSNINAQNIGSALSSLGEAQKQNQLINLKAKEMDISLAKSGLKIDSGTQKIIRDDALTSPLEKLISRGKVAQASKSIYDVTGVNPLGGQARGQGLGKGQIDVNGTGVSYDDTGNMKITDTTGRAVEYTPGKLDEWGKVTEWTPIKETAAQDKRSVEKTELGESLEGLLTSWTEARSEGKEIFGESFGSEGLTGRVAGKVAKWTGYAGHAPAINVYNKKRKAFATVLAKAAGEVRPTDQDILRFMDTMFSVEMSDKENSLILDSLKVKLNDTDFAKQLVANIKGQDYEGAVDLVRADDGGYIEGKTYEDDDGNTATYLGNGEWEEIGGVE